MISERLQRIEAQLRRETACHRYAEVERLARTLCQAAAEQTKLLPAGDSQILAIAAWVNEVLEWTRVMLTAARAADAGALRRAYFAKGYLGVSRTLAQMSLDL